jgi:hypothetical protein
MEYTWKNVYVRLIEFINQHNELEISSNRTSIPATLKADFYSYFDELRYSFVKMNLAEQLERANKLSREFKLLREKVLESEAIDNIELSSDLSWFLENPVNGLARFLFGPLMKLLAGTSVLEEFESVALKITLEAFDRLFDAGYQRFIELGMILLLAPDKSYTVPAVDGLENGLLGEGHELPGQHIDRVPWPQESRSISFEQYPVMSFIVPRILLHSTRNNSFVAMHFDFREAEWTASKISGNMEWYRFSDIKQKYGLSNLRPDLFKKTWYEFASVLPNLAVYVADNPNDLALVADFNYLLRPEINIEFMVSTDWYERGCLEEVKRHHEALKPKKGSFVICQNEIPAQVSAELGYEGAIGGGISIIHSGYDIDSLDGIVAHITASLPVNQP